MRYLVAGGWLSVNSFAVVDAAGAPRFEADGNLDITEKLSFRDPSGALRAVLQRGAAGSRYEISVDRRAVATVRRRGVLRERYEVAAEEGTITARSNLGGDYPLRRGGRVVAAVIREPARPGRIAIDVAAGQDGLLLLVSALAIESMQHERMRG